MRVRNLPENIRHGNGRYVQKTATDLADGTGLPRPMIVVDMPDYDREQRAEHGKESGPVLDTNGLGPPPTHPPPPPRTRDRDTAKFPASSLSRPSWKSTPPLCLSFVISIISIAEQMLFAQMLNSPGLTIRGFPKNCASYTLNPPDNALELLRTWGIYLGAALPGK